MRVSSRRVTIAVLLASALLLPAATPAQSPPPDTVQPAPTPPRNIGGPGDYGLREKLISELAREPGIRQEKFTVVLVNGGAVFSGEVGSHAVKQRILTIAAVTRGVINVTDQMSVKRADLPHAALQKAVTDLLQQAAAGLGLQDARVEMHEGVATLEGSVPDLAARIRAEEIAGGVLGVRQILNHLQPRDAPTPTDDASLLKAVVGYLGDYRHYAFPAEITVAVRGGVVTLEGRCAYYLARQQAALLASFVKGVTRVENHLKVDPSLQRRGAAVQRAP
jgi:hyperosmotically inducible periplasmic protein